MSTAVVLIADTHLPKRAKVLPDPLLRAVDEADVVIHAGDWVDTATLDLLEQRSSRLIGVYGNNDHGELRRRLPEVATAEIERIRISVVHETGAATGRERRMDEAFPDTDLLVFGHSHIPWDTTAPSGLRLVNPGSPTDRRRQPHATFMTLTMDDGTIGPVELVRLPPR
ncbi:hypothetical protein CLV49_3495 [Labedella gwakjiensis]|uniref:Phosphoesterase n=1 Tax=Labedella gwakjiensis TaxID=390269 RepID=A0A2P8H0V4_9MICO|nr:metallophosphoesterase [Labedella gwakjiensis]PSL39844.1 hypothetical protein CLV49_3495 [Labedella gwakjiensis]